MVCIPNITIALIFIACLLIVWYCRNLLRQKTNDYSAIIFQRYLIIAENLIETTVIKLNETAVKKLKAKSQDGKLSKEDGEKILQDAINTVKKSLGAFFINVISEHMGDFDTWLLQQIEKYVSVTKNHNHEPSELYDSLNKKNLIS
jgi:hypothetical protein